MDLSIHTNVMSTFANNGRRGSCLSSYVNSTQLSSWSFLFDDLWDAVTFTFFVTQPNNTTTTTSASTSSVTGVGSYWWMTHSQHSGGCCKTNRKQEGAEQEIVLLHWAVSRTTFNKINVIPLLSSLNILSMSPQLDHLPMCQHHLIVEVVKPCHSIIDSIMKLSMAVKLTYFLLFLNYSFTWHLRLRFSITFYHLLYF